MIRYVLLFALAGIATPTAARDSLGMFGAWGAFRDPSVPRCYAIAKPASRQTQVDYAAFASVGTWARRGVRGQVHFRLSRKLAPQPALSLSIGRERVPLTGGGGDAWAVDRAGDARIVAAMRSAGSMAVSGRDARGRRFSDRYALEGAATAMDAAALGCASTRR